MQKAQACLSRDGVPISAGESYETVQKVSTSKGSSKVRVSFKVKNGVLGEVHPITVILDTSLENEMRQFSTFRRYSGKTISQQEVVKIQGNWQCFWLYHSRSVQFIFSLDN